MWQQSVLNLFGKGKYTDYDEYIKVYIMCKYGSVRRLDNELHHLQLLSLAWINFNPSMEKLSHVQ